MSEASLSIGDNGSLMLGGVLDHRCGDFILKRWRELLKKLPLGELVVDCSAVTRSSSVGLALLLTFMRDAHHSGRKICLRNLPDDMKKIAQVSQLLDILPFCTEGASRENTLG